MGSLNEKVRSWMIQLYDATVEELREDNEIKHPYYLYPMVITAVFTFCTASLMLILSLLLLVLEAVGYVKK